MANTLDTLNGYFKRRYGDKQNLVPEYAVVSEKIPFSQRDRIGDNYNFPVKVRRGQGTTYNGGSTVCTAFSLNPVKSGQFKNAQVAGTEFMHRDSISYGAASRAQSSGEAAFGDSVDELYLDMAETAAFHRELTLLYGGDSMAATSGRVTDSGTTQTFRITKASWAPGIWSQMEGAYIDAYDSTLTTKRNTAGTLEVTAIDADPDDRVITLVGTEAEMDTIVDTDVFVPRGAKGNWFNGLKVILNNSGSLFGIDAATYSLWKSTPFSFSSAAPTMAKIQNMVCSAVARGLMGEYDILLSPYAWNDLNNDHAALRRFAQSTKGGLDLGTTNIEYYGVNGGVIRMTPHPMVKTGDAFGLQWSKFKRIGSTDITFELRNGAVKGEPAFFTALADAAGFELRCYWDQALICTAPARMVYGSGIVTSTLGS